MFLCITKVGNLEEQITITFEEPGWLAVDKFLTINGDYYRFDSSGIMEQGSFRYYDKDNDKLGYKLADLNGHVFMYEQG